MDVKIKNGDILTDARGNPLYTREGIDDIFQQVLICITAKKGGFIYDKDFGADAVTDVSGERERKRLEASFRAAAASVKGAEVFVKGACELIDGSVKAEITVTWGSQSKTGEVVL